MSRNRPRGRGGRARRPILYTVGVAGLSDNCAKCDQEFPYSLPRCPMCRKAVCEACSTRMGGNTFCGTDCSHAFFFGTQDEVDESGAPVDEDGE